jgi:carbon monoxide dehydrogenase subunit G
MEAQGQIWLAAGPETVWQAMTDPEVLRVCVPGCQQVWREGPYDYRFELSGRWGVIHAAFRVQVTIHDLEPADAAIPNRYALSARGEGPLGFAKGASRIDLAPERRGTYLIYDAAGDPDSRLGRLGQPLLRRVADTMSDKFFRRFADAVNRSTGTP